MDGGKGQGGRDAGRTREAILDAAERLFAEQGYDGASLQAIGRAAGVSRGTPGYFFGAKEALYRAVLERLFADELERVLGVPSGALPSGAPPPGALPPGDTPAEALAGAVANALAFLAERPAFVRLLDREAVADAPVVGALPAFGETVAAARASTEALLRAGGLPKDRAETAAAEFLLVFLALCWFPSAHAATFGRALGVDPADPAFRARWARTVTALLAGFEPDSGPAERG